MIGALLSFHVFVTATFLVEFCGLVCGQNANTCSYKNVTSINEAAVFETSHSIVFLLVAAVSGRISFALRQFAAAHSVFLIRNIFGILSGYEDSFVFKFSNKFKTPSLARVKSTIFVSFRYSSTSAKYLLSSVKLI